MEKYQAVANGPVMWLACTPAVLIVLFQAFLFYKKSRQQAVELKMDPNQIKITMRSAAIASIGPCMVIMATLLALIQYVGTPLAWMRCDIIGAAQEEMMAATIVGEGMGMKLTEALTNGTLSLEFLSTASLVMAIGMFGYVVLSGLFADKTEMIGRAFAGGKAALLPIVSTGAVIGGFSIVTTGYVLPWNDGAYAVLTAGAATFVLQTLIKKYNIAWLKEWSLTFSMLIGMLASYFISLI